MGEPEQAKALAEALIRLIAPHLVHGSITLHVADRVVQKADVLAVHRFTPKKPLTAPRR